MSVQSPQLLALDFDGVICNGLVEYFKTTCRAYCKIWAQDSQYPTEGLAASFFALRPVIETGWEMPVLLRALIIGVPEQEIWQNWPQMAQQILATEKLNQHEVAHQLDSVRDNWIKNDLENWLGLHQFYDGVITKLRSLLHNRDLQLYIVSTKEGRFIRQLLQQQGLELSSQAIIGKESQRPKYQTLKELIARHSVDNQHVWFVEDRLKALQAVKAQSNLEQVQLFLADWGYNTSQAQENARQDQRIRLLSLQQFHGDFSAW